MAPVWGDQGNERTCVAYAFTRALTTNVFCKYGVSLPPEKVVEKPT